MTPIQYPDLKNKLIESTKFWASYSTFHALPKLSSQANSTSIKLIWFILAIAVITIFTVMSTRQVSDFFTYEVTTEIRIVNETPIPFPTVTICNINPFTSSLTDQIIQKLIDDSFNGSTELSAENSDKLLEKFYLYTANPSFGDEKRKALGRSLEETVVKCKFNYRECTVSNFSWVYMRDSGFCWQFNNANEQNIGILHTSQPGLEFGLVLELFTGTAYNLLTYPNSGMLIFISNYKEEPLYYQAIDVETGVLTNIQLKKRINRVLATPFSDCVDPAYFKSVIHDEIRRHGHVYTQGKCLQVCYQIQNYKKCGCYDLYFESVFDAPPCLSNKDLECTNESYKDFLSNGSACDSLCPNRCERVSYDHFVSISEYPSQGYFEQLKQSPILQKNFGNQTILFENVNQNMLAIRIFFDELSYTLISESPKLQSVELFANIGSLLGLFTGMSFLSLVEYVDLAVELIFVVWAEKQSTRRKIKTVVTS